jgi:glycosyltransferase involved in cell wall biosynthesis
MKVLHIASGKTGGAYKAGKRLFDIQAESGIDVHFLTNHDRSALKRMASRAYTLQSRLITRTKYGLMSIYSLNGLSLKKIRKINPDVIHIHNWFNLLSVKQIQNLSGEFPIVFTMHDERLLTGGCHNHLDCGEFKCGCQTCPATRLPISKIVRKTRIESEQLIRGNNITITTPSMWLKKEAEANTLGEIFPIVLPNPLSSAFYNYSEEFDFKRLNGVQQLLFIAANPWVPLKGLDRLIITLKDIEKQGKHNFNLTIVGSINSSIRVPNFVRLAGAMEDAELVQEIRKSDLVIVSSYSENLPSVISESQYLGVVVVATNVGGIPEMISDMSTGLLQRDGESFPDLIKRALDLPFEHRQLISTGASAFAKKYVSKESIVNLSLRIYAEALDEYK